MMVVVGDGSQEQVSAESSGALLPSLAPRDIPSPHCVGYVVMLANLLGLMDAVGEPQDEVGGPVEELTQIDRPDLLTE